jgi:hypothetical protein
MFSLILKIKFMLKIIKKTTTETTYQLQSNKDSLTLQNLPFEIIVKEPIILSQDNQKVKNQISLF